MIPANKIIDEFTDLPVSRQRKWQLRNPEKHKVIHNRFQATEKSREYRRKWAQERRENDRNTNAKASQ